MALFADGSDESHANVCGSLQEVPHSVQPVTQEDSIDFLPDVDVAAPRQNFLLPVLQGSRDVFPPISSLGIDSMPQVPAQSDTISHFVPPTKMASVATCHAMIDIIALSAVAMLSYESSDCARNTCWNIASGMGLVRKEACPQGHSLTLHRTQGSFWICDICRQRLPQGSAVRRCSQCDFDVCRQCHALDYEPPSTTCKLGHPLAAGFTESHGYQCNSCWGVLPNGTEIRSCRACDFDICNWCRAQDATQAPP
jgi:hypothetical protein